MPLLGQASGGWTESSSALRILNLGVRNSVGVLTTDGFTQNNPPVVTAANTISSQVNTQITGILSGSVCFTRPDGGANFVGGPTEAAGATLAHYIRPLGCFINDANGYPYQNLPAQASGKAPYVSSQGTYGNGLFETQILDGTNITNFATGDAINYVAGMFLISSRNGYLMPSGAYDGGGVFRSFDAVLNAAESTLLATANSSTVLAVLKMPADAVQDEIVYDQRI